MRNHSFGWGLVCLLELSTRCWSVAAAPSPSALPCTGTAAWVAPDTHVFFPDENLERLALRLSSGLYADKDTYDRLVRDATMIRSENPGLRSVGYRMDHDVRVLRVTFKPLYFWLARTHLYWDWSCLNRFLGAAVVFHPEFDYAELTFSGLYNPHIVERAYGALPGLQATEFSSLLGDSSGIYVTREAAAWHYIFDLAGGDCPAGCTEHELHYFAVSTDGRVQTAATWRAQATDPPPSWAIAYFRKFR
jgi:hypothetical protein